MGTGKENRRKIWGLVFCIVFLAVFAPCRKVQAAAELSKTYVILLMGQEGKDTYSMEVSGTGKGSKVEFSIKDASVAAVDEKGKISALSPGKTTLVCTVTDKEGKETVKKATVRVYDNIKAITLSVKDVEKNALHKNKSYALAYTCKTVAGTNKNIDNYIHYEVLSLEGKTVKDASVDAEGNFLAKSTGTYLVRACAFQSDQQYKKWEKDSEKYADYILAQDEIRVTVTTTNYKKTAHKIGDYTVNLPKDYELDIFEKGKERTAFSAMVEKEDGQSAVSNIQVIIDKVDGAQDYDFVLRSVEAAGSVHHIPKVLYHWRAHKDSTSENPQSKMYAFEAGKRAVQAHYDRIGIAAKVHQGEYLGLYKTEHILKEHPLISLIIPNKDHIEDLDKCISSIEQKSTYDNYEYIIVENNSENEETFRYYKDFEKENPRVHVVCWEGEFNYSAINNYGAKFAKGEYLLLLNNDTEIINGSCLEEMIGYCMHDNVGAVGARLYYSDETIQHAGVIVGFGGIAGHAFIGLPRSANGYFSRIICAQDMSAVTAACMMVKKSVFEEVGGLSTELQVAFNDIDLCMKIREAGYLIVYNPYAELYHYESKSRGLENTKEKVDRFNGEIATFAQKWPEILKNGDPYYNPNLSLERCDFSLK